MRVTLDVEEDTIVQIRRSQNHENQLLSNLVSTKVAKAKQKPLEEAYSKQRVVYTQRKASIQGDPKTSKVLVSFIICNLLNNVFIIFIILGQSQELYQVFTEETQAVLPRGGVAPTWEQL